jgi:hypothetical protein
MDPVKLTCSLVLVGLVACGGGDGGGGGPDAGDLADAGAADAEPGDRDILSTALSLDLTARTGEAYIALAAGSPGARFEIGDLDIASVDTAEGPLGFTAEGGTLSVDAPAGEVTLHVTYTFADHGMFDGWDPTPGLTFLWPYFCKNLFPCDSRPADGLGFTMAVTGVPGGLMAIYPEIISGDAPSYMPAVTVGDYTYEVIGTTSAGTEVGVYYLPGGQAGALEGASGLAGYFGWMETTIGPYLYGDRVASVSVDWGPGDYGGMEHHPLWHIDDGSMTNRNTHAHEAAHGWFGNGIRIRCWEDFVLSEGVATYLAARAIEEVDGVDAGNIEWQGYLAELEFLVDNGYDTHAWPTDACNSIDIFDHPLWSGIPYYKGAFFMRELELELGRPVMDDLLGSFYAMYSGQAAGVQDFLDLVQAETGFDPGPLATAWLRGDGIPR